MYNILNNVIANADDLGLNPSVNSAILFCFNNGIINSTSLMTNTYYYDATVKFIHENQSIINIGVHVNLAEGKPVTNFAADFYLDNNGNWDISKTNKKILIFNKHTITAFKGEIFAQIDKAISSNVSINHLDSHYHLHTLPGFYQIFMEAAKYFKLKLRLSQTYNEGNQFKFLYRRFINNQIIKNNLNYSYHFETASHFTLTRDSKIPVKMVEVMLHPDFDASGNLTDHYDAVEMERWFSLLKQQL